MDGRQADRLLYNPIQACRAGSADGPRTVGYEEVTSLTTIQKLRSRTETWTRFAVATDFIGSLAVSAQSDL